MKNSRGYTLVELLIAVAIGVVILYGVTTTFTGSVQTSATAIRNAQFDQEMRATMSIITRDLRRSGYSSKALDDLGSGSFTNDFLSTDGEDVRVWSASGSTGTSIDHTATTVGTCVTYSYDAAATPDGVLTTGTSDYRGFKFENGIVYKRTSATATGANCANGVWSALTSNDVVVTGLTFQWIDYTNHITPTAAPTPSATPTGCTTTDNGDNTKILQRVVRVTLSARSAKDSNLTRTLTDDVKVRNYAYNPCGSS